MKIYRIKSSDKLIELSDNEYTHLSKILELELMKIHTYCDITGEKPFFKNEIAKHYELRNNGIYRYNRRYKGVWYRKSLHTRNESEAIKRVEFLNRLLEERGYL